MQECKIVALDTMDTGVVRITVELPPGSVVDYEKPVGIELCGGLAAIRAEITLVSGVVQALATSVLAKHKIDRESAIAASDEWDAQQSRLVRLLAKERELMDGGK